MPRRNAEAEAEYQSLWQEYKKLAQTADKRMQRLEGYAKDSKYENILKWSYAKARKEISKWGGVDKTRFGLTKPPKGINELKARLSDVKQFMESKTSTLTGIKVEFKARADRYNKEFGTNFTWQQYAEYHQSGLAEKLDNAYGYRTSQNAIAVIQKNKKKIVDEMQQRKNAEINGDIIGNLHISDDSVVNSTIAKILNDYGIEGIDKII